MNRLWLATASCLIACLFAGCAPRIVAVNHAYPQIDHSEMNQQGNLVLVVSFSGDPGTFPADITIGDNYIEGEFLSHNYYVFRYGLPEGVYVLKLDVYRFIDWCDKSVEVEISDTSKVTYIYAEFEFFLPETPDGRVTTEWQTEVTQTKRLTW